MTANISGIGSVQQQMQTMAAQAAGGTANVAAGKAAHAGAGVSAAGSSGAVTAGGFSGALKASLDRISADQQKAAGEAQAFEVGAPNVSLNDVMIDMQKANVGFQFGLQVRNRLVSAYQQIMQMSV